MNIVLLGHTGFVGKNIAELFSEEKIAYSTASLSTGVDFRDTKQCIDFFTKAKPDIIINCAATVGSLNYVTEQAADVILDNSRMILSMYEAIAKICPNAIVINPIANCAYPAKSDTFIEDEWWNGHIHRSVLSYGSTKRLLWSTGESFSMQYGIRSIYLLTPNMYGPYDSTDPNKAHALNALVSKFVKAANTGQKKLEIWGTGIAIREWLYAKDFGRIILRIIKNTNMVGLAEPVNIAQHFGLSVRELVGIIRTNFNYSGQIIWDSSKPDGAPRKVMDDRKFKNVFPGFKFTPLTEGIQRTIDYYEKIYPY